MKYQHINVSYLAPADQVSLGRQHIDDFSFAFISPLRAEHDGRLVADVVPGPLEPGRGGRVIAAFVVFWRPGERHDGGLVGLSVCGRLD